MQNDKVAIVQDISDLYYTVLRSFPDYRADKEFHDSFSLGLKHHLDNVTDLEWSLVVFDGGYRRHDRSRHFGWRNIRCPDANSAIAISCVINNVLLQPLRVEPLLLPEVPWYTKVKLEYEFDVKFTEDEDDERVIFSYITDKSKVSIFDEGPQTNNRNRRLRRNFY